MNALFLDACFCRPTPRAPIWIMRQAGRYLPEYRKIRSQVSFLELCKTPELAAEVTLQPVDILGVDAAIIFSDILIVPEAMGLDLVIEENKGGPRLSPPARDRSAIQTLKRPTPEIAYRFLGDALRNVKTALEGRNIPLIGFAGSPWTLLTYIVEGGPSRDFAHSKRLIYQHPQDAHRLLKKLAASVTDLLNFQIESGAEAVQIFDSWGGVLTSEGFEEFSLEYVKQIIAGLKTERAKNKKVPILFFPKGNGHRLEKLLSIGANVIGLDWTVDLGWAKKIAKNRVALQGNLDPTWLYASPIKIRQAVSALLQKVDPQKGYIFNLGHGILPDTPVEHVKALVQAIKKTA